MIKRQYSKSSWVGRVYKWYTGGYINTDSCDVRNVVLFKAPFKFLFTQDLTWFEPISGYIQPWFLWATATQILMLLADWEYIGMMEVRTWHLLALPFIGLALFVSFVEAMIIVFGVLFGFGAVAGKMTNAVLESPSEHLAEWWYDFKNKVCRPIEWS